MARIAHRSAPGPALLGLGLAFLLLAWCPADPARGAAFQLLPNGGFETNADGNRLPDGWTGKSLTRADARVVNHDGSVVARTESAAFRFSFRPGAAGQRRLRARLSVSGSTGDGLYLSGWAWNRSLAAGSLIRVKLTFLEAGVVRGYETLDWGAAGPSAGYVQQQKSVSAPGAYDTVTVALLVRPAPGSSGRVYFDDISLVAVSAPPGWATAIPNIYTFLDTCPQNDPNWAAIQNQFSVLLDGFPAAPVDYACAEPYSAMPVEQVSDALIAWQTFRTAYYMKPAWSSLKYLPWTTLNMFDWMASRVDGINIKAAPGQTYCCDPIGGKVYFSSSANDDYNRAFKQTWKGISLLLEYFAHEVRHRDVPDDPGHTTGCPDFPDPLGPKGCDYTYDLNHLGAYGVQYWLAQAWATGFLNVGISCDPARSQDYVSWHVVDANGFRDRFVVNPPPVVSMPGPPYGGSCRQP